jgi:hypothetical protein
MSQKEKSQRTLSITTFIVIVSMGAVLLFLTSCTTEKKPQADKSLETIDPGKLTGRWLRPDGGYIIEIINVHNEGTFEARYLNPRSINISRAEWKTEDNRLKIYIEFDDVNYPGSNYTLDYFPDRDLLIGAYFQAIQQQSFYVEFIRQSN